MAYKPVDLSKGVDLSAIDEREEAIRNAIPQLAVSILMSLVNGRGNDVMVNQTVDVAFKLARELLERSLRK
jgi:hypothetical protein